MNDERTQEEIELQIIQTSIERDLLIQQLKEKYGYADADTPSGKLKKLKKRIKELKDERHTN